MNRVWFVGAGPGDPQLLTLRGAQLLQHSREVFAFPPFGETFGEMLEGKTIRDPFDYSFAGLRDLLHSLLQQGDVIFLVPGDLAFFCPFQPLIDALGERAAVVPGVGNANAAAAALKRTLNLSGVCSRTVLVSGRHLAKHPDGLQLPQLCSPGTTLLLYMNTLPVTELVTQLRHGYGGNVPIALLHRLGLPGQDILLTDLDSLVPRVAGRDYFATSGAVRSSLTLIVAGEALTAMADEAWWDQRAACRGELES